MSLGFLPYKFPIYDDLNYMKPSSIVTFDKNFKKYEIDYLNKYKKNKILINNKLNWPAIKLEYYCCKIINKNPKKS